MAVCTNKQEHLAIDLLKKIGIYDYFEYVAGSNTFDYCKPDPRHLTSVIEILGGDLKKSLMIGDSETDANAAKAASIPVILLENGYTEKNTNEIYHNHLIKDFIGIEKIVSKYFKIDLIFFVIINILKIKGEILIVHKVKVYPSKIHLPKKNQLAWKIAEI